MADPTATAVQMPKEVLQCSTRIKEFLDLMRLYAEHGGIPFPLQNIHHLECAMLIRAIEQAHPNSDAAEAARAFGITLHEYSLLKRVNGNKTNSDVKPAAVAKQPATSNLNVRDGSAADAVGMTYVGLLKELRKDCKNRKTKIEGYRPLIEESMCKAKSTAELDLCLKVISDLDMLVRKEEKLVRWSEGVLAWFSEHHPIAAKKDIQPQATE